MTDTYLITEADAIERGWSRTDDRSGLWSMVHGRKVMLNVELSSCCDSELFDGRCESCGDPIVEEYDPDFARELRDERMREDDWLTRTQGDPLQGRAA